MNESINYLEKKIQSNTRNVNALQKSIQTKTLRLRKQSNLHQQHIITAQKTLDEMQYDANYYKELISDDSSSPEILFDKLYKIYGNKYAPTHFVNSITSQIAYMDQYIRQTQSHGGCPGQQFYELPAYISRRKSEINKEIQAQLKEIIADIETNLIPKKQAEIQLLRQKANYNATLKGNESKLANKHQTIKNAMLERNKQLNNIELRKNRYYNYFRDYKNMSSMTNAMWNIPETMNMTKLQRSRKLNPLNIPVYKRTIRKRTNRRLRN